MRGYLPPPWSGALAPYVTYARTASWCGPPPRAPASVEEVAAAVRAASRAGRRVRVVGKLHSYSDCARGDDVHLDLRRLQRIEIDGAGRRARVEAGASIRAVCDARAAAGFALAWAGNYGEQTLVGAALTGTHGYARHGGTVAELIVAMTIVDGDGAVHEITDEARLRLLRVSFGALALVVAVTIEVVPSGAPCRYHLWHLPSAELFAELEARTRGHDHFHCFPSRIVPGHHAILTIDRLPDGGPPPVMAPRVAYVDRGWVPGALVRLVRGLLGSPLVLRLPRSRQHLRVALRPPGARVLTRTQGPARRAGRRRWGSCGAGTRMGTAGARGACRRPTADPLSARNREGAAHMARADVTGDTGLARLGTTCASSPARPGGGA